MNTLQKLDSKTVKTSCGCWLYVGSWNHDGYGRMIIDGKQQFTHRLSYAEAKGPIPADMNVLHRCDIRCCRNPDHLFLGTHTDNMQDAAQKGRLTRETIEAEKIAFIKGNPHLSLREVAKQLGVGATTVFRYRSAA